MLLWGNETLILIYFMVGSILDGFSLLFILRSFYLVSFLSMLPLFSIGEKTLIPTYYGEIRLINGPKTLIRCLVLCVEIVRLKKANITKLLSLAKKLF